MTLVKFSEDFFIYYMRNEHMVASFLICYIKNWKYGGKKIPKKLNSGSSEYRVQILPSKYFKVLVFYLCRFRGYFQDIMSNVQALVCHPRSLFHRSDSKSSLNIGVRPIRPMYAGVVRMEMHNINGNHSPNMAARRSRPQHLVNGTGNKTASKGTYLGILYNLIVCTSYKSETAAAGFRRVSG